MKLPIYSLLLLSCSLTASPSWANDIRFKVGAFPLRDFIETTSGTLGLSILFESNSSGPGPIISVSDSGPLTQDQAMTKFMSILGLASYSLVRDPDLGIDRVVPTRKARDLDVPLLTSPTPPEDTDLLITYAFSIQHFPVDGLARILRSFAPTSSRLIPYSGVNLLFINDTARAMGKYAKIIANLDTPESAKSALAQLKVQASKTEDCAEQTAAESSSQQTLIFVTLFALIGLILGFLIRGYLIRRIEGGL